MCLIHPKPFKLLTYTYLFKLGVMGHFCCASLLSTCFTRCEIAITSICKSLYEVCWHCQSAAQFATLTIWFKYCYTMMVHNDSANSEIVSNMLNIKMNLDISTIIWTLTILIDVEIELRNLKYSTIWCLRVHTFSTV